MIKWLYRLMNKRELKDIHIHLHINGNIIINQQNTPINNKAEVKDKLLTLDDLDSSRTLTFNDVKEPEVRFGIEDK